MKEHWLNLLENEAPNGSNLTGLKYANLAGGDILEIVNKALDKYEERSKEDSGFYTENRNGVKGAYVSSALALAVVGMKPLSKGVEIDTPEMGRDYLKTLNRIFDVCGDVLSSNMACTMLQETGARLRYEGDEEIAKEYLKLAQNCITKADGDSYIKVHMREADASKPFIKKIEGIVSLHPDMAGQVLNIMTKLQNGCKEESAANSYINNVLNNIVTNNNIDEVIREKAKVQIRGKIEDKKDLSNSGRNETLEGNKDKEGKHNSSSGSERKTTSRLAQFLYKLGDVAAGKVSFKEFINELGEQRKEERKQLFDQARGLLDDFKRTVKESYQDRTMENKYDMSAAVATTAPDGKRAYIGVRDKPTPKQQLKQNLADTLNQISSGAQNIANGTKDMAAVLSGNMSWDEFDKKHPTKSWKEFGQETFQDVKNLQKEMNKMRQKMLNSNKVTRAMASVEDGLRVTFRKLRGLDGDKQPQPVRVDRGREGKGGFGPNRGGDGR